MKIIVAIVVYDRLHNIYEWIRCWQKCKKENTELYVIHNFRSQRDTELLQKVCTEGNVHYVKRTNYGMDIGAFQDVCRERLETFPNDWDYLFWTTDDVLPMSKKFLVPFINNLRKRPSIAVTCLELSHEVKTHIRTTGFMISKETSRLLEFPKDRVESKMDCYDFEHRSPNAFYEQIKKMQKGVLQVEPDLRKAPLWDSHVRGHLKRYPEHYREFPK